MIKQLDDNTLVDRIKNENCAEALTELISRHSPICFSVIKKYLPKITSLGIPASDVYDEKDYIIWRAAMNFNPDKKSKISTWISNQVRYKCLNLISHRREFAIDSDAMDYLIDNSPNTDTKEKNFKNYIINVLNQINDPRIKKIYKLRYFNDSDKPCPWSQIGKKLKISAQTAINLHNKHKTLIKNKLKSKNRSDFI